MSFKKKSTVQWLMIMSIMPCVAFASENANNEEAANLFNAEKSELVDNEVAQRNVVLESLWASRANIKELEKAGAYQEADLYYNDLIGQLAIINGSAAKEKLEILKQEQQSMRNMWMSSIIEQAQALAADGKYEEAKGIIAGIIKIDEVKGSEIAQKYIDEWQAVINGQQYVVLTDISDPDWQKYPVIANLRLSVEDQQKIKDAMAKAEAALLAEDYDTAAVETMEILTIDVNNTRAQKILEKTYTPRINKLFLEAETYIKANRYTDAVRSLEKVYLIDPYNIKASVMLDRVYRKIYAYAHLRHRADVEAIVAEDDWGWVEPVKIDVDDPVPPIPDNKKEKNPVMEKMEKIIFDKFEIADAPVVDIINQLNSRANRINKGEPIDIIVKADDRNPKFSKKSSFSFSNIPMSEILRYVTLNFGLKYKIEGNTVIVGDGIDNLVSKSFKVRNDLIATILSDDIAASAAPIGGDDDMGDMGMGEVEGESEAAARPAASTNAKSSKIMEYFRVRGIDFPEGSSVYYAERTNKLSVRNTEENLRRLGELLEQLMIIETPMVMTDVKIIQVTETNFEELGFDWEFTLDHGDNWAIGLTTTGSGATPNVRHGSSGISDSERNDTALIKNINIFPKLDNKIFGATPNLKLTVYALSENGRGEILSTPRLISESGRTATIRMVNQDKFPESWEEPEVESSGDNTISVTYPLPELGEFEDYGITLSVTPVVASDNRTITLDLKPSITTIQKEAPDSTYNIIVEQGVVDRTTGQDIPSYSLTMPVWMPEKNVKEINCVLKVYDGETIMIGGVMQNEVNRRMDKMPIFGDIPFIGRLFQNRAEDSNKVNYLIFVTARLINNSGRPVKPLENIAVPNFNY